MSDKQYPSNLYLESAATNLEFAKRVSAEAVAVMAKELLALRELREGWQMVPVEPTEDMMREGFKELIESADPDLGVNLSAVYRRILASSPAPHE